MGLDTNPTHLEPNYGDEAKYITDGDGKVIGFLKPQSDERAPVPVYALDSSGNPVGMVGPDGDVINIVSAETDPLTGGIVETAGAITMPIRIGAPASYTRTRDGATDSTYAELASISLPASMCQLLGTNGFIDIESVWTATNVTPTKDLNVLVGGVSIGTPSLSANQQSGVFKTRLYANGATNSQLSLNSGINIYTGTANAPLVRTLDMTTAQTISIQCKWSADPGAAATITLLNYIVTIYPGR